MKLLFSLLLAISLFAYPHAVFANENLLLATTNHCGSITANETWSSSSVHRITCDVTVGTGVTLTIGAGTVVKFNYGNSLIIDGTLKAVGTGALPIYFTSEKDDTPGGDTNGDGSSTVPNPGDWSAVEFRDPSSDANSIIDHAIIRYGGRFVNGIVTFAGASPRIQNSTLAYSESAAFHVDVNSFPTILANLYQDNHWNGIRLTTGTFTGNRTLNILDAPYILDGDIFVGVGSTLTINAGVVVKVSYGNSLTIDGTLRSLGTAVRPIHITSYKDDSIGGDTNGDGSATVPMPGDWSAVEFRDTINDANTILDYTVIRYGGRFVYGNVTLTGASPQIHNSIFAYSESAAIFADTASYPTLENNDYQNNHWNGIRVAAGTITGSRVWNILDAPYVIDGDLFVGVGSSLTVNPGVIVKFAYGSSLIVDGTLRAVGTPAQPITFTSYKDDSIGDDTNGDGSQSEPMRGDWSAVQFRDPSSDANSIIDHAVIRYGGRFETGMVTLTNASPKIRYTIITEGENSGISTNFSSPVLTCNNIFNNQFGLRNQSVATVVNATAQWWGDPTGPYHKTTNPNGKGNEVSDGVTYSAWRTTPCNMSEPLLQIRTFLPVTRSGTR